MNIKNGEHILLKVSSSPVMLSQNSMVSKQMTLGETEDLSEESFDSNQDVEVETGEVETGELKTLEDSVEENTEEVEIQEVQITTVDQSEALLQIESPQDDYMGSIVVVSPEDRYVLERLVMGEAGNQGYEGACLVAQCIRDTMVYDDIPSVEQVRVEYKYSGKLIYEPNQDVLNAVSYIFDQGGIAVKHKIQYFYAPRICDGAWHETQEFVIEHGGHKFFAKR